MDSLRSHNKKPRLLFVAEAVSLAHVARPVALLQTLETTEYDIHFAADRRYDSLLPPLSGVRHEITTIESSQFLNALRKGSPIYDKPTLTAYMEEDLRLIEQVKPDLIVGDFRLSLSVSARVAHVPYATITNAYWSPYYREPYPLPDLPFIHQLGLPVARMVFRLTHKLALGLHTRALNAVRKAHGLKSLGANLKRGYTDADHVLYADLPDLFPLKDLPPNHAFIGPVLWSPSVPCPTWWNTLPKDRPIVYVSLGTTGQQDLLPCIVSVLGELPVTAIVSTAGSQFSHQLPTNVHAADYLPGDQATALSSLVVCNGGSMTTYQSLARGVPVIGLAGNMDQHFNMNALQKQGAGWMIRSDQLTEKNLSQIITSALSAPGKSPTSQEVQAVISQSSITKSFRDFVRNALTPNTRDVAPSSQVV